jgi:hypothetical protein
MLFIFFNGWVFNLGRGTTFEYNFVLPPAIVKSLQKLNSGDDDATNG